MSESHFDFSSKSTGNTPVLLEARRGGVWHSVRVSDKFLSVRAAMDSLPMFAQQQEVDLEDVRVRALWTVAQIVAAMRAVDTYNTSRK